MDKEKYIGAIESFPKRKILVLGDYCIDRIWNVSKILPNPEAPVMRTVTYPSGITETLGAAGNVSRGLRALQAQTYVLGVIGMDEGSRNLLDLFLKDGINTEGMFSQNGRVTPIYQRLVSGKDLPYPIQTMQRLDLENDNLVEENVLSEIIGYLGRKIQKIDAIILADYQEGEAKGVVNEVLIRVLSQEAKEAGKILVGDSRERFHLLEGYTAITPNRKETDRTLESLNENINQNSYDDAKKLVERLGLKYALTKRDRDGLIISSSEESRTFPATTPENKVIEVCGAGDVVTEIFTLGLASGLNCFESAELANIGAGIAVQKSGVSVVSLEELLKAIN
ncbi:MAG: PfkB family carbohydrate kinase [Nanoarchaeota archaeon]